MNLEKTLMSVPVEQWQVGAIYSFEWYDGPRAGVCVLRAPEAEFAFDLLDERYNPDGLDDRLFRLSELPPSSVAEVIALVSQWPNQDAAARQRTCAAISAIEARKRPTSLIVYTQDWDHFLGCWQVPPVDRNGVGWFAFLGIPQSASQAS